MATPDQESIETFVNITGSSELVAIQKLTEHGGNLNEAVNAHFTEGDTSIRHETDIAALQEDFMDIDEPSEVATHRPPFSPSLPARDTIPFSLLDSNLQRHIIDSGQGFTSGEPFVSYSREAGQAPIEAKDGTTSELHHPESAPRIDYDDDFPSLRSSYPAGLSEHGTGLSHGTSRDSHLSPSAPGVTDLPDYFIEEEMIQAAIEASKHDAEIGRPNDDVHREISLSLKSAEQEKAFRELESEAGPSEKVEEVGALPSSNGRLGVGGSSIQDETEDDDEQPLVWRRTRRTSSRSTDTAKNAGEVDLESPSGSLQQQNVNNHVDFENETSSDEWGGISSEEHDEAVMLEAAMFGGIPDRTGYRVPHHYIQTGLDRTAGPYRRSARRPPSPSLTAQRLIREQQDDEYLAALQADREKELQEQAAREAAMQEERRKEEEEQEIERQLAEKEASLSQEPTSDDENAITILVRMPDGSRRGRRFLRTDKLQCLFDFIDVGRVVKPSTYRLVRPYPRHAFGDGESNLTLNEVGLTSKQEALFLELI